MPKPNLIVALALSASFAAARAEEHAEQPSLAMIDISIVDHSALVDAAAVQAALARSGKSPSAWLAEKLASSGAYTMVDPSRVAAALESMGVPAARCAEDECAVSLGNKLPASRVVYGTLIKVSNLISYVDATLLDVPSRRVLRREEIEIKGDISLLLGRAMTSMAQRLTGADPLVARRFRNLKKLTREQVTAFLAATGDHPPPDLTDLDLSGLDFSGVDFKRADLSRSNLSRATFKGARMFAVKLTDARLGGADLEGAVLDLAVLEKTDLTSANLQKASLYAAILTGAILVDADLRGARIIAPMAGARLTRAKLGDADLGADPGNQPMGIMRTDASSADFTGADLHGANLRKVNFTRADLSGADLTMADVAGADFSGAILRSIRGRSQMRGVSLAKNFSPPE